MVHFLKVPIVAIKRILKINNSWAKLLTTKKILVEIENCFLKSKKCRKWRKCYLSDFFSKKDVLERFVLCPLKHLSLL